METERLIIRRFVAADWLDLYEYLSQAEVVKFEPYGVFTKSAAKLEAVKRSDSADFWAVCTKETGKLIGNLYMAKQYQDSWELGYVFNANYHGDGYATEAAKHMVNDAFVNQNARRVTAMCNPLNTASWRLLERLHFRREGHLIQNIYFKTDEYGEPIWADTYEYAILHHEWLSAIGD